MHSLDQTLISEKRGREFWFFMACPHDMNEFETSGNCTKQMLSIFIGLDKYFLTALHYNTIQKNDPIIVSSMSLSLSLSPLPPVCLCVSLCGFSQTFLLDEYTTWLMAIEPRNANCPSQLSASVLVPKSGAVPQGHRYSGQQD